MINLKNKHKGKDALLISGGPSALESIHELHKINRDRIKIFLEAKALTPLYQEKGVEPDYYLLPYPEKSKDNTLQNLILQAMKVDVPVKPFFRKKFHFVIDELTKNKSKFFIPWNPKKGPHKNLKHRPNIYFKDSPYDLIRKYDNMKIITDKDAFKNEYPDSEIKNEMHYFRFDDYKVDKSYENYINPIERNDEIFINTKSFTNTAAISTFPIINYMGIKRIFFLGYDMNMMGTFEYNATSIFKSSFHHALFIFLIRHAIRYFINPLEFQPLHLRPKKEFIDLENFIEITHLSMQRINGKKRKVGQIKNFESILFEDIL